MLQVIVDSVAGGDDSDGFIKYILDSRIFCLALAEMSSSYVVEEGPSEEVLKCNESENMDSNMCETLSSCTYFEKSVPVPSTTINSDTSVRSRTESKA